ncbi:hypothetical protein ACG3RN_16385 [Pseudomonas aeruginosa]
MRHLFVVVRDVNGPPGSWLGGAGKAGAIGAAGTETRSARKTASPEGLAAAGSDHAAANLVFLDGLEQGLEIALAEALVALALDDLKMGRSPCR